MLFIAPVLRPCSSWTANSDKKLNVNKPQDFSKNSLSKVLQNFLSIFKMSLGFGKILKKLNANFGKILRKEKNFKENLMNILIGLWKYFKGLGKHKKFTIFMFLFWTNY